MSPYLGFLRQILAIAVSTVAAAPGALAFDIDCQTNDMEFTGFCPISGEEKLFQNPEMRPDNVRGITIAPIEDMRLGEVGYGSRRVSETLAEVAHLGANWISLTPFGRMDTIYSVDILPDFETPVDINENRIRQTARRSREQGLKVAIIPHIYVMSGDWRGEIDMRTERDFELWFSNYEEFAVRWAKIAAETKAEMFSIGVEFKSTTNSRRHRWRQLIDRVRSVYSGSITYSANWDEFEDVEFWDALDLIGINAFWPLARKPGDGYPEMEKQARDIASFLEGFALLWNRPVVFTEFGIKTATDSALAPWEWPENCHELRYDEGYQAAAYQAVFDALATRPWFEGLFIWKYFSDPYDETQEERTGFSPRAKLAETTIYEWFRKSWGGIQDSLLY